MYINRRIYKIVSSDEFKKSVVSDRVKKYLKDLYDRYHAVQNMDTLQPVYSYEQMGNALLSEIQQRGDLIKADAILFPAWGMSWNMDYAAPELHWKRVFGMDGKLLDVRDCGSLCVYYSIHIMLKLYASKYLKNALICSVEHAWLFCKNKTKSHAPQISYVGSFQCSNDNTFDTQLEILSCRIANCQTSKGINQKLNHLIQEMLGNYKIRSADCQVWVRACENIIFKTEWRLIEYPISSGFLYSCIDLIFKNTQKINHQYFLIIDFDPIRFSIGAVLLKRLPC